MPHVRANGLDIYYEMHGNAAAAPLVMSHGYGGTSQQWLPHLLPLTAKRPLIVYDTRGHGQTTVPEDDAAYSLAAFTADLAALLDALGVEKAHIGGQSLGGFITARFAVEHPARCASVLLCDTSAGNGADAGAAGDWERFVQMAIGRRADNVRELGMEEAMRREYFYRKENDPEFRGTPYTLEDYLRRARTTQAAAYAATGQAIVEREDLTARLGVITVPTLVMVGDRDGFAPCGRRDHALIPGSRLVVRRDCGHGFKWRMETWLAEVEAFLSDVEAGRPVAGEREV